MKNEECTLEQSIFKLKFRKIDVVFGQSEERRGEERAVFDWFTGADLST